MSERAVVEERHRAAAHGTWVNYILQGTPDAKGVIAQLAADMERDGAREGYKRGVSERGEKTYDEGVQDGMLRAAERASVAEVRLDMTTVLDNMEVVRTTRRAIVSAIRAAAQGQREGR